VVVNPNYPMPWFTATGGSSPPGGQQTFTTQGTGAGDYDWDAVMQALAQQNEFNQGIQQGGLNNQTQQIGNTHQYQMGLLAQAQAQLAQAAQQFEQTYGLQVGSLTGMFQGQPTLAALGQQGQMTGYYQGAPTLQNLAQQAQYTGMYGQTPTLQAINQGQQFGLQQGALTGTYQGGLTLPAWQAQQQAAQNQGAMLGHFNGMPTLQAQLGLGSLGIAQAGVTGQYNGTPTQQAQQQAYNQWATAQQLGQSQGALTGTYGGAPTLAAQQLAQQGQQAQGALGLQTLQLGASLGGPSDWLNYSEAASGARQNPLLAQGVASWADMTNGGPRGSGGWGGGELQPRTLGTLQQDVGGAVQPGQQPMPGAPPAPMQPGQPAQAGLSPQEQARFQQLADRAMQLRAAGEPMPAIDLDEMQRFQARGAVLPQATFGAPGGGQAQPGGMSTGGGNQSALAQQWAAQYGQPQPGAPAGGVPWQPLVRPGAANQGGTMFAGGTPGFRTWQNEGPGSMAPAGPTATGNEQMGAGNGLNQDATSSYMAQAGKRTNEWAPGFWGSLNSDQQDMYKGAWKKSGQSPSTVLANRARNSISQGWAA
jgi:hypothetical protein